MADELEQILRLGRYRQPLEAIARDNPEDEFVRDLLKKPSTGQ